MRWKEVGEGDNRKLGMCRRLENGGSYEKKKIGEANNVLRAHFSSSVYISHSVCRKGRSSKNLSC